METKVKLISWTKNPIETVYLLWQASRTQASLISVAELLEATELDKELEQHIRNVFIEVVNTNSSIMKHINFTLLQDSGSRYKIPWTIDLLTLKEEVKKITCWKYKSEYQDLMINVFKEIYAEIDPIFSVLATPPCMVNDDFKGCTYLIPNSSKSISLNCTPPCSLFLSNTKNIIQEKFNGIKSQKDYQDMEERFSEFWRRDYHTGKKYENKKV